MEGKGVTSSNIRALGKQIDQETHSHEKAYGLVRRNVREAWKLEKSYQGIEVEKAKVWNKLERLEKDLLMESEKIHRTSGSLMSDVNLVRAGLPKVVISPSTTKRSKLPWKKIGKAPVEKRYQNAATAQQQKGNGRDVAPTKATPVLPRLQKAMEESRKNVSEVGLFCKKIQSGQSIRDSLTKGAKGGARVKTVEGKVGASLMGHRLRVPQKKPESLPKAIIEKWRKENNWINLQMTDENTEETNEYRKHSVSVT